MFTSNPNPKRNELNERMNPWASKMLIHRFHDFRSMIMIRIYIYIALKLFGYHAHLGCGHAYQTIIIMQTIAIPWISWVECHLIVMAHGVSKFMISALFSLFIALPPGHPWRNNLTCRSQSIEIENTKKKQRHLTQLGIGLDWIQLNCIHRDFIVKNGSWNVWNYH